MEDIEMDQTNFFGLPSELLFLWHAHRTEILLSAGILFACMRLAVHWRKSRSKQLLTSPLASLIEEEKTLTPLTRKEQPLADSERTLLPPKSKAGPKRVTGVKRTKSLLPNAEVASSLSHIQPHIFYFSLSGTTVAHANHLLELLTSPGSVHSGIVSPSIHDLSQIDHDDFFITPPNQTSNTTASFYMLLLPTYNISTTLSDFLLHLQETHHDFRIDTHPLSALAGYAVFGFGDKDGWPTEQEGFCQQAVEVDKWMARLTGGKRAFPLGVGDVSAGDDGVLTRLEEWTKGVIDVLMDLADGKDLGEGVVGSGKAVESEDENEEIEEEVLFPSTARKTTSKRSRASAADLEDLKAPIPVDFTTSNVVNLKSNMAKPMVPVESPTHTALTKQGYKIVGSHSGVKICRWTKSALRGRGSCYKYSFYGIASHLCMEATPSLSCSNKCVFCWRHGTNPVSTTWKWTVDPPDMIFDGMKQGHYSKIKMMKGVPGVRAERFEEAMRIRHCALSLVGEPIFYPRINELLGLLHKERISTFLVCNAQHPDQLAALDKVTQLYVSIDASNKDSLKRIDRPLHRDFWERFCRCMDILRERRFEQRTVFRLTLVKDFNIEEEVEGYADLVQRALPAFVEVKGVTYCGTSTSAGAGLSMRNVPFYEEVSAFVLALEGALKKRGLEYGIGAEHAHSCCILLADKTRFFRTSKTDGAGETEMWHTRIDFEGFFNCLESGGDFGPEDYIGDPTPEWALWGNGGFDPRDVRVDRKGRKIEVAAGEKREADEEKS